MVDPHQRLPFVDAPLDDFTRGRVHSLQALRTAPMGMTCHIIFRVADPGRQSRYRARRIRISAGR